MGKKYQYLSRAFLLAIVSISFTGCFTYKYNSNSDPWRINDFPTPAHNRDVELLFEGETPPDTAYIKTHFFEVYSINGTSYANLARAIKSQAQSAHVDAVLVLTPERYDLSTFLAGVGIKYKDRVDYLAEYRMVDQLYLYNNEEKEYKLIANLYPDFNNQIFKTEEMEEGTQGDFYFKNFIQKFSIPFLTEDKSQYWGYNTIGNGIVNERIYRDPGLFENFKVIMNYDTQNRLNHVEVEYKISKKPTEKYNIELSYNEQGQIVNKMIMNRQGRLIFKEVFTYNEEGKLFDSEYFQINGDQQIPFLKTNYFYFYPEDIYEYF